MIDNRRRGECITCGKDTSITVTADGIDDAPSSFVVTVDYGGGCPKVYIPKLASEMHEQFGLPLSGWTHTRY